MFRSASITSESRLVFIESIWLPAIHSCFKLDRPSRFSIASILLSHSQRVSKLTNPARPWMVLMLLCDR
jgi:hypothetical protein